MKIGIVYFIVVAYALAAFANAESSRPNILLITSEDNGPQLSCYGDPYVRTPNLDRLAAKGVRFDRAFVATASCSESRAAILTGLYPHQNGQIGLANLYRMYGETPNIVGLLRANGYRTGLIGKLHILPESAFPFDYRPDVKDCNTYAERNVRRVAQLAREFFAAGEAPFFLMVNYPDAHLPFVRQQHGSPANPLASSDVRPLPWIGLDTPQLRESQADYYNCLMRLDDGVGELLAALKAAEQADNTLVIYLGDHGAQFPRGKLCSYESSLNVPLIMCWPGHIRSNIVRDQLVATVDLLPTVLQAAGISVPTNLPGKSLLPLIENDDTPWREYLFSEYHSHVPAIYFPQRTVRDDRYKLIVNLLQDRPNPVAAAYTQNDEPPHSSYITPQDVATGSEEIRRAYATWTEAPPIELYDLRNNPYEFHNRADDPTLADVKSRLLAALKDWQSETSDPLRDPQVLVKLTAEQDAAALDKAVSKSPSWDYLKYMSPVLEPANP